MAPAWHMTTDDIRKAAIEIQNDPRSSEEKKRVYESIYPDFFTNYATLAQMCCDGKMEIFRLDFMLQMLDQVKTRQVSQEKASESVGKELFDTYVAPKVGQMKKN